MGNKESCSNLHEYSDVSKISKCIESVNVRNRINEDLNIF